MFENEPQQSTAANYLRFSRHEAAEKSPLYAELTESVAHDPAMLAFLAKRPPAKRQPNLLLGAVRYLYGTQRDYASFRAAVLENQDVIADVVEHRRTQTNEPGRCAVLLPFLARLPQPLALLEVGAAAGLCLLPDRYGYRYGMRSIGSSDVVLECAPHGAVPIPRRLPEIMRRAGIDLDPVDVTDDDAVRWLEALIWPDQPERTARLRQAINVARREPPGVVHGNLLDCLEAVASEAPEQATLVVFHTAVLAYLDNEQRHEFARQVHRLDAEWLSNEARGVTPGLPDPVPAVAAPQKPHFVVAHRARPIAFCDPHGFWIQWLGA